AGVQAQPALSPDGRSVAFASDRDGAYNIYVGLLGGGNLVQITRGTDVKAHPAWSADGAQLAYAQLNPSGLWDLLECPALGGTPRLLLRDARDPNFSRDGQWLAFIRSSSGALWRAKASGLEAEQLLPALAVGGDDDPRFSADGSEIAFVVVSDGPHGWLEVLNLTTKATRALMPEGGIVMSPAWSPDGGTIYYASSQGGTVNVWKLAVDGRSQPVQVTAGEGDDAQLDLSADGRRLVFASYRVDSRIAQLDLAQASGPQRITLLTTDPARYQNAPAYSPDGRRLAYFSYLKGVENEQIWTSNADGSAAAPLVDDDLSNVYPRWSPNGANLFFTAIANGHAELRSIAAAGGTPQSWLPNAGYNSVDVGSRGGIIIVNQRGAFMRLDARTRQSTSLPMLPADAFRARWAPGEAAIAYA
ncbi:MAG: LpqB family beta-propeller domain-containing protein, partial [Terriglobales bacterium]